MNVGVKTVMNTGVNTAMNTGVNTVVNTGENTVVNTVLNAEVKRNKYWCKYCSKYSTNGLSVCSTTPLGYKFSQIYEWTSYNHKQHLREVNLVSYTR